jgi:hypothetical protein
MPFLLTSRPVIFPLSTSKIKKAALRPKCSEIEVPSFVGTPIFIELFSFLKLSREGICGFSLSGASHRVGFTVDLASLTNRVIDLDM